MPELPEVETVRRGLEKALQDARIVHVDVRRAGLRIPFPADLKERLEGRRIERFLRRAKYLWLCLDDGQVLVIHLGMSGRILITRAHVPVKHDHLILSFADGQQVVMNDPRRFGMVFLSDRDHVAAHAAFAALGPEPLGNDFSGPVLARKLAGKKVAIKQALLDQRVVSGVGNIYACEALYESGISPLRQAGTLDEAETETLCAAIHDVLTRAIGSGGSSLRDYRQASGELGYFQHDFKVYDKAGDRCSGCDCGAAAGSGITRIIQGGRSTFYCPHRQR